MLTSRQFPIDAMFLANFGDIRSFGGIKIENERKMNINAAAYFGPPDFPPAAALAAVSLRTHAGHFGCRRRGSDESDFP